MHGDGGGVEHGVDGRLEGGRDDGADPVHVGRGLGPGAPLHPHLSGGVDDGVAPLHGDGDGNRIGHVSHGHRDTHPVRVERGRDASRISHQDPDVVAVAPERGDSMGADEPGRPGHEHQHVPPLPGPWSPPIIAYLVLGGPGAGLPVYSGATAPSEP